MRHPKKVIKRSIKSVERVQKTMIDARSPAVQRGFRHVVHVCEALESRQLLSGSLTITPTEASVPASLSGLLGESQITTLTASGGSGQIGWSFSTLSSYGDYGGYFIASPTVNPKDEGYSYTATGPVAYWWHGRAESTELVTATDEDGNTATAVMNTDTDGAGLVNQGGGTFSGEVTISGTQGSSSFPFSSDPASSGFDTEYLAPGKYTVSVTFNGQGNSYYDEQVFIPGGTFDTDELEYYGFSIPGNGTSGTQSETFTEVAGIAPVSDLSAAFSAEPSSTLNAGSVLTAVLGLTNSGDPATGSLAASFNLVPINKTTNNGQTIAEVGSVSAAIADDVTTPDPIPVSFTVPVNTPPGAYVVVGTLTDGGGITDTDTGDKTFSSTPITITGGSDLSANFATQPESSIVPGDSGTATFAVGDAGPDEATGLVSASFNLVPTDSATNDGTTISGVGSASASIADDVTTPDPISVNFTVPASTPPGTYDLVGMLTDGGGITDSDTSDKTFSSTPITVTGNDLTVAFDDTTYAINAVTAKMPMISATAMVRTAPGEAIPHKFKWSVEIAYHDAYADEVKTITRVTESPKIEISPSAWEGDRGGDLTVAVNAVVNGKSETANDENGVTGSEPGEDVVNSYLERHRVRGWPASLAHPQADVVHQIINQENGYSQFDSNGDPAWSSDGKAGAGLMQITPASFGDIWDWQTNVTDGIKKLQSVIGLAGRYRSRVQNSPGFKSLVSTLNVQQRAAGLAPLHVILPGFTTDQQVLIAIRAYNGAGGTDSVGLPVLQEFELAVNAGSLILSSVDQRHYRALASWIEVLATQRSSGDPNYVNNVLDQST